MSELLTSSQENRFVLFPIKYDKIWQKYKKQLALYWTVEEIDFFQENTQPRLMLTGYRNVVRVSTGDPLSSKNKFTNVPTI